MFYSQRCLVLMSVGTAAAFKTSKKPYEALLQA